MVTERHKQIRKNLPKHGWKMGEAMRASGYSDTYARNPHRLKSTKGYNKVMSELLGDMREEQERVLREMKDYDLSSVEYKKLSEVFDSLTKNIALAEGKPTEITESTVRGLSDADLEALVDDNVKKPSEEGTSEEGAGEEAAN